MHLHGLRDPIGEHDNFNRRRQAERLVHFVADLRWADDFTAVCGDFNLLPGSETFEMLADIGIGELVGDADTRSSSYAKSVRHASYTLVSDPAPVSSF